MGNSKIKTFIKSEAVMLIALILAASSCLFVTPSLSTIQNIDFRVLSLLLCLMLIVAGFRSVNLFTVLAEFLFKYVKTLRCAALVFVLLCYFSGMLITNDVALILFVPFSIFSLEKLLNNKQLILLIVLETIAANLGSMFTPIGNPQNLYLFTLSEMNIGEFFLLMLPYSAISLITLIVLTLLFPSDKVATDALLVASNAKSAVQDDSHVFVHPSGITGLLHSVPFKYAVYIFLFALTITTVIRITPFQITLVMCVIFILITDYRLIFKADYCLLLTFIGFFIFVGNISEISSVSSFIVSHLNGNVIPVSIISSQFISNVPAAILLSDFTTDYSSLIIGVNLGGLGTLIASMASLISYKFYIKKEGSSVFAYLLIFTVLNILFLIINLFFHFVIL